MYRGQSFCYRETHFPLLTTGYSSKDFKEKQELFFSKYRLDRIEYGCLYDNTHFPSQCERFLNGSDSKKPDFEYENSYLTNGRD